MTPTQRPTPQHTAPLTDEEIAAYTIGEPQILGATVLLCEYDPRWPRDFDAEDSIIRAALGPSALRVEHFGSTSVPGLAAKPIIDIMLVVADTRDEPRYVPPLLAGGYRLRVREPNWHQHRVLVKRREDGDDRSVNLHVFSDGCTIGERDVIFRDWLRAHGQDRELYERTKRELAGRVWKYIQNYADAKTEVIEQIRTRAGEPATECTGPCRTTDVQ